MEGSKAMDPQNERERLSAMTASMVSNSRDSCEDGAKHIRDSRKAIERSLRLLGKRFHQIDD